MEPCMYEYRGSNNTPLKNHQHGNPHVKQSIIKTQLRRVSTAPSGDTCLLNEIKQFNKNQLNKITPKETASMCMNDKEKMALIENTQKMLAEDLIKSVLPSGLEQIRDLVKSSKNIGDVDAIIQEQSSALVAYWSAIRPYDDAFPKQPVVKSCIDARYSPLGNNEKIQISHNKTTPDKNYCHDGLAKLMKRDQRFINNLTGDCNFGAYILSTAQEAYIGKLSDTEKKIDLTKPYIIDKIVRGFRELEEVVGFKTINGVTHSKALLDDFKQKLENIPITHNNVSMDYTDALRSFLLQFLGNDFKSCMRTHSAETKLKENTLYKDALTELESLLSSTHVDRHQQAQALIRQLKSELGQKN